MRVILDRVDTPDREVNSTQGKNVYELVHITYLDMTTKPLLTSLSFYCGFNGL